jgi:hypothetical protein
MAATASDATHTGLATSLAVVTILIIGRVSDRLFRRAAFAGAGWVTVAALLMAALAREGL